MSTETLPVTAAAVPSDPDGTAVTTAGLAKYEAVVFLNTTGDVLTAAQQTA